MAAAEPLELIELDSNYAIAALGENSAQSAQLEEWLTSGAIVQMSAIAWSEYLCGPSGPLDETRALTARRMLGRIETFNEADAELASELFNATGRRSRSHVDCMIAAHAIGRDALLATLNFQDFARFEKFQLKLARKS